MSRNIGVIVFHSDARKMWIKYNATVEQCYPKLYDSPEDVAEDWYTTDWPICFCGNAESASVYPYDVAPPSGKTVHWEITACRNCRCIVTNLRPNGK